MGVWLKISMRKKCDMLHAILTHSHAILKFSDKYLDQRNMRKTATDHPELTKTQ